MPMQTTTYLYRPVLKRAWEITKKFKPLWLFGLFAALVSAGGEYEMIYRAFSGSSQDGIVNNFIGGLQSGWAEGAKLATGDFWGNLWQLTKIAPDSMLMVVFLFLLILILFVFFVWLAVSAQIALIKGASLANKNKKMSWHEGFTFANSNFFPVLGVVAVLKVILFALFLVLGWELWLTSSLGIWGTIIYIISFIFFVLVVLVISFVLKYQVLYLTLKKQGFVTAFKSAWRLFVANWLVSLEMSLIMLGIYLVASALTLLLITLSAGIPIIIIPFYLLSINLVIKIIISILAALLALIGVIFITATVTVFQWSGWVALFERLDSGDEASKLERFGQSIKQLPDMFNK